MLKFANHDIVFQEFPDEVTLAINLTHCPIACPGCHSLHLWEDVGEVLTKDNLLRIVDQYGQHITCVALMGGDRTPAEVLELLHFVRQERPYLKTGWYSGREHLPTCFEATQAPNYVKLGSWRTELGPLSSTTTNHRMWKYSNGKAEDITFRFQEKQKF